MGVERSVREWNVVWSENGSFLSFLFGFQLLLGFGSWVASLCREEGEGSEEEAVMRSRVEGEGTYLVLCLSSLFVESWLQFCGGWVVGSWLQLLWW